MFNRSVLLTGLTLLSLAGITPPSVPARADTTLVIGLAADPTGFDPEAVANTTANFVMGVIYDSLIRYESGTAAPAPGVAERWEISPDGRTYTFHLRHDVRFHDGTKLDAQAVFWNIDRLLNKNNPQYIYNTGTVEGHINDTYEGLIGYRAIGDDAFEFTFKSPVAPFLNSIAMEGNGLVSPAAAAKWGSDYRNHPVGSGPFIFREHRARDQVILDANPEYWHGRPKVDHLVFKEYPEPQAAVLALKRDEIQILCDLSSQSVPAIRADPNLMLLTQPGMTVSGVALPTNVPPFNDRRVRQAMNYAIDKEALNKGLYQGLALTMTSPVPNGMWSFDPTLPGYPYDPEKAKALLTEAGVKDLKVELLTYNSARGYNPVGPALAVAIQGYLKKIGVDVSVRQMEVGAYLSTVRANTYQGWVMEGWTTTNGDPDNFVGELFGGRAVPMHNWTHYADPTVDKLIADAVAATDRDQRAAIYREAQARIMEDAPWLFINSTTQVHAARKNVKGYVLNPLQMFYGIEDIWLEP
jgi:peptide/nickel transport system substrate-binding protein